MGHFSPPLHKWAGKRVLSPCRAYTCGSGSFFPSLGDDWPRAMTIECPLMGGYSYSHERVEDSCMGMCMKFGGLKTGELEIWYV